MKIINQSLLDETSEKAKLSPRLRMNHNFHTSLDDPLNRLLNAMEPGTYIRPHRHLTPAKEEVFLLLSGKAVLLLFDNDGNITDSIRMSRSDGVYGADLEAGIWHSLLVLESGTVIYEVKKGPFAPLAPEDFAPWSPEPSDTEAVDNYLRSLERQITV